MMIKYSIYLLILSGLIFTSGQKKSSTKDTGTSHNIEQQVTETSHQLNDATMKYETIALLDHHAMAKEEGVYTPPSIAAIFSDPKVNTELIKANQLVGLDLPFKTLCYTEADTSKVSIAYTSGEFIAKRHKLEEHLLSNYNKQMNKVLNKMHHVNISETNLDSVTVNFGLIKLQSDFDFASTVQNLKNIVNAQSDTKWFGDIDFQKDAKVLGETIAPTTLLLFGGPAPGGKAMATTPKIGLDAFCQKLLVYENSDGEVWIAFNEIGAFSKLYYGFATKPQNFINQRLTQTFTKAITE